MTTEEKVSTEIEALRAVYAPLLAEADEAALTACAHLERLWSEYNQAIQAVFDANY